jgi:hypothetical protein
VDDLGRRRVLHRLYMCTDPATFQTVSELPNRQPPSKPSASATACSISQRGGRTELKADAHNGANMGALLSFL